MAISGGRVPDAVLPTLRCAEAGVCSMSAGGMPLFCSGLTTGLALGGGGGICSRAAWSRPSCCMSSARIGVRASSSPPDSSISIYSRRKL